MGRFRSAISPCPVGFRLKEPVKNKDGNAFRHLPLYLAMPPETSPLVGMPSIQQEPILEVAHYFSCTLFSAARMPIASVSIL